MRPTTQRDAHLPTAPSATPAPHADLKRRRFLLALGAGSAATAAAATQAVAAPLSQAAAPQTDDAKRGYHATDHVRTYYLRLRHKTSAAITLDGDYELEDDDYELYQRNRLGVTWRF